MTFRVPLFQMPPPPVAALFPVRVLSVTFSVPSLAIPPPFGELPFSMVRPEMVAVARGSTRKTSTASCPLTDRAFGPGPSMLR